MSCPITGLAVVTDDEGTLRWDQSDPAIHVSSKLLDTATEAGLAFLTERYELGEWCPHDPFSRHARHREVSAERERVRIELRDCIERTTGEPVFPPTMDAIMVIIDPILLARPPRAGGST
jgi:hypothetical protein